MTFTTFRSERQASKRNLHWTTIHNTSKSKAALVKESVVSPTSSSIPSVAMKVPLKYYLLLLLLNCFSRVRLCVTPWMAAHQTPPSWGFSRQEQWSGLPFPSPMHESEVKVKSLSHVQLFATPWTAAYQAPPSMGFSRQEYLSGVLLSRITQNTGFKIFILNCCSNVLLTKFQKGFVIVPKWSCSNSPSSRHSSYPGTNQARPCLGSEIRQGRARSGWYGRRPVDTLKSLSPIRLYDSTVHGILQARILEWVAFPSPRGSSWPRDQSQVSDVQYYYLCVCVCANSIVSNSLWPSWMVAC